MSLPTTLAAGDDPLSHILPQPFPSHEHPWAWKPFGDATIHVTNHLVMLLAAAVLMLLVFPLVARRRDRVPTGLRNLVESILQFLRENVARPALHGSTDRFMPFLWTIFFLILFANLLGALPLNPIFSLIAGRPVHWAGTATGNIMITGGLALCAFFAIHVGGILEQGFVRYCKNFAPHVPWPLLLLLVPLEIVAAFVKPFALAIRLFANMIAGHIVLAILLGFTALLSGGLTLLSGGVGLASVLGATVISLLELFVAFLQAFIFTFLTALFLGMAVHPEH